MAMPQGFTSLSAPGTNPISGATYCQDAKHRIAYSTDAGSTWFYVDNGARVLDVAANTNPSVDPTASAAFAVRQANSE